MNKIAATTASIMKHLNQRVCSNLTKSLSTCSCHEILKEVINFKDSNISNWIIEKKIKELCYNYEDLPQDNKHTFIKLLARDYSVNHEKINELTTKISLNEDCNENWLFARERDLKNALIPTYHWLFTMMGRLENGVKFLVDLRTDILELLSSTVNSDDARILQQLNQELKDLFLLWFSVGFLHVERITWQSSCDMLEKISNYEVVHPIRNWTDLKQRVGPYRRCYVFTHPSMPMEPLVLLHTALCDVIPDTVKGIQESKNRIIGNVEVPKSFFEEDKTKIKAAIFYSIAATQKGLQGIELGNYLIKKTVQLINSEFPLINQYSTLSPVPNFRLWLLEKIKLEPKKIFSDAEMKNLKETLEIDDLFLGLKQLFNDSLWMNNEKVVNILKKPMLRSCAWYLYKEKRRSYALNIVANFHLRNGAVLWRINWMSDPSPRGAANSCGIMVNYRYYVEDTVTNSRNYIEKMIIKADENVINLVNEAARQMDTVEKGLNQ